MKPTKTITINKISDKLIQATKSPKLNYLCILLLRCHSVFSLSSMFAILMEGIQIRYVKLGEEGDRLSLSQSDSKQPQGVRVDNNIVLTNMLKYI